MSHQQPGQSAYYPVAPAANNRTHNYRQRAFSQASVPPPGSILTGKQEHYLKRELLSQQIQFEISELSSPTALQRFGAPFRSDVGEVPPEDSELPILRYIFVHHVRNFPFLDQAREKEFWQDKVQVFLESFARKNISSSEDRLEETKRRKLALKAEKMVELMMVSGIPTASGYEERIQFAEMEVVDRGANDQGLVVNIPEGRFINGWDVNVAGVRTTSVKRTVRYHQHAQFILRVKTKDKPEHFIGRRYGEFAKMRQQLQQEMPGKILPQLPRKNKTATGALLGGGADSDDDSVSSASTQDHNENGGGGGGGLRSYWPSLSTLTGHRRASSTTVSNASTPRNQSIDTGSRKSLDITPRRSMDTVTPATHSADQAHHTEKVVLFREEQRVSLRAFLRTFLQNEQIAKSKAMREFLCAGPFIPNREEQGDIARRKEMDEKRIEEQRQFYEIARSRAAALDVHMEKFRRDIVERNGLTRLFKEIRQKTRISELSPEYQKFAEWARIEVAAVIYHLFLAEDNSPEVFAQVKRIHSLIPYSALKGVIRFSNPAAVMKGVLDLFLAQPLGAKSLMQRMLSLAINDGIKTTQKSIDAVNLKIADPVLSEKIKKYTEADEAVKDQIRREAFEEQIDLLVVILRSDHVGLELKAEQIGKVFNAYVAFVNAVENTDQEMRQGAQLFAHLKQLLKLHTRQRDKLMMMSIIEEPVTLQLFRDLFTIFYEPLVRVYKSANVYSSVTDFSTFLDDVIKTVDAAARQDVSADPNQTVQAFIDLCARHEDNFYKFVHEVHIHDNGLFDSLMNWLEGILEFLRHGPGGGNKLDMNALFQGAADSRAVDPRVAVHEIDQLIGWQKARKQWHADRTRRKMAAEGTGESAASASGRQTANGGGGGVVPMGGFTSADFGLNALDLEDMGLDGNYGADDYSEEEEEREDEAEDVDPIDAERRRRQRLADALKSRAGEPAKPNVAELLKLRGTFIALLRGVLAE